MNPRKVSDEMHKMGVVPVGCPLAFYLAHVLGLSTNSFILLDFVDICPTNLTPNFGYHDTVIYWCRLVTITFQIPPQEC